MSQAILMELFPDRPCFVGRTYGIQGVPVRHVFMTGAVDWLSKLRPGPIKILEIGSWIGSSALTWSQALDVLCPEKGEILCVDPWDAYFSESDVEKKDLYRAMNQLGRSGLAYDLFLHNISFAAKSVRINHFRGKSRDCLPYLADASFDLIYIDGSHYVEDVTYDLERSHRLLKPGGLMCGDDLELQFMECDQEFTMNSDRVDYVRDPRTGKSFHPGVTLAVHRFFGEVSAAAGFWAMHKTDQGYEKVTMDNIAMLIPAHFPLDIQEQIKKQLETK